MRRALCAAIGERVPVRRLAVLLVAVALAVFALHTVTGFGGRPNAFFDIGLYDGLELVAALALLARAWVAGDERIVWLALGAGIASQTTGDLIFSLVDGGNPPVPSVSDLFYLAYYPLTYAGLAILVFRRFSALPRSIWLDGLMTALAVGAIAAAVLVEAVVNSTSGSTAAVVTTIAYPIGDLMLLSLVVAACVLVRSRGSDWLVLCVALTVQVAADSIYLLQAAKGTYLEGTLLDVAWPLGTLLVALSAWLPDRFRARKAEPRPLLAVPALCTATAIGILLWDHFIHQNPLSLGLAIACLLAVLLRTWLTLREHNVLLKTTSFSALHDDLTGLPNRTLLYDRLAQALARSERDTSEIAVLELDVDNFKLVNDSLGHAAGDQLLVELAARLRSLTRAGETVARLGGDEFALVAEGVFDERSVAALAERVQASFADPFAVGHAARTMTGSVGIAIGRPGDDADASNLLRDADTAMYRAKGSGRGCFDVFGVELRAELLRRVELEGALEDALAHHAIEVHYQPIASVAHGRVLGAEALARWTHPRLGPVPAEEFIRVAEQSGLILPLGRQIMTVAVQQLDDWRRQDPGVLPLGMFVNVSPRELEEADFASFVLTTLREHRLSPGDLMLELTERVFIDGQNEALATNLRDLTAAGVRLALDDFGTGYSALASLKRFPLVALKIDRFFISSIAAPDDEAPVIRAIVGLCKALGLMVIVEGVEDQVQLDYLRRLGCDAAQGFLLARPHRASRITGLLAAILTSGDDEPAAAPIPRPRSGGLAVDLSDPRPPVPVDEPERLAALRSYDVLDTEPDPVYDDLVALAARACRVPMAFVSLVDQDREFFKAAVGTRLRESPRDISFCGHGIAGTGAFVVPDALADPRFATNPNVLGGPKVRFYAGVPLVTSDGYPIGMFCVKDTVPRALTGEQLDLLGVLARQVVKLLELHRLFVEGRAGAANARVAAAKLHRLEASYELLFDGIDAGALTTDADGRIVDANPAACRELGYSEQELVALSAHALFHPSPADGARRPDGSRGAPALEAGETSKGPHVLWRKDGSSFEIEHTAIPVVESGRPKGTVLLFRNVEARKAADRELRRARARYRALVENSRDMIGLTDMDGILLFASRSHEAVLGYTPEELVGRPVRDIVDGRDFERGVETVARAVRGDETAIMRGRMRRKDGSLVAVEGTITIVEQEDGSPAVLSTNRVVDAPARAARRAHGLVRATAALPMRAAQRAGDVARARAIRNASS